LFVHINFYHLFIYTSEAQYKSKETSIKYIVKF